MYERSAIVLERYLDKLFGFDKKSNLKNNLSNFKELVEELSQYQSMVVEEEKVIVRFDDIAKEIQSIQKTQEKLSISNQKLEDERNKIFNSLEENPNFVQSKLEEIEKRLDENNGELKEIREEYIKAYIIFIERQKERVKFAREKREIVSNHMQLTEKIKDEFKNIPVQDIQKMNKFIDMDKQVIKNNIVQAMIRNGKNEKVGFDETVISKAVDIRLEVLGKEAECYLIAYERVKKLLLELESDSIRLNKYEKVLKDISVKIAFLESEKNYIVEFLDNERVIAMSGAKVHSQMMIEACKNFEMDVKQINNLYELILKEATGKSTKKAYNELYNKNYLRDIEQKERNFEKEVTSMRLNMGGALINSNYWRIEGIKNVYEVFLQEITEKYEKDLSEYKLEELENIEEIEEEIDLFAESEETINEGTSFEDLYSDDFNINFYDDDEEDDNDDSNDNNDNENDDYEDKEDSENEINKDDNNQDENYDDEYEDDYSDDEDEDSDNDEDDNYIYSIFKESNSYADDYDKFDDYESLEANYEKKHNHRRIGKRMDAGIPNITSKINDSYNEKNRNIKMHKNDNARIKREERFRKMEENNKGILNKLFGK